MINLKRKNGEAVWIRIYIPRKWSDRLSFLRVNEDRRHFKIRMPCGRVYAFDLEDLPPFDVRCECSHEFVVQWVMTD